MFTDFTGSFHSANTSLSSIGDRIYSCLRGGASRRTGSPTVVKSTRFELPTKSSAITAPPTEAKSGGLRRRRTSGIQMTDLSRSMQSQAATNHPHSGYLADQTVPLDSQKSITRWSDDTINWPSAVQCGTALAATALAGTLAYAYYPSICDAASTAVDSVLYPLARSAVQSTASGIYNTGHYLGSQALSAASTIGRGAWGVLSEMANEQPPTSMYDIEAYSPAFWDVALVTGACAGTVYAAKSAFEGISNFASRACSNLGPRGQAETQVTKTAADGDSNKLEATSITQASLPTSDDAWLPPKEKKD